MYNSTGAAAQKASRRKAKVKLDSTSQNKDDINLVKTIGQGEGSEEIQSVTDSTDNSPQIDSDGEVGWASDDLSTDKIVPECSVEKKTSPKPLSLDVSRDNIADLNEIHWEIPNFNPEVAIYESSKFDHADQSWNFSFGHNNANGYGYILCLNQPQVNPLHLLCSFNMLKAFDLPYTKTRQEAYVFGINSMNSRGFVNFASTDDVKSHVQSSGCLKLSANIKVVACTTQSSLAKSSPSKVTCENLPSVLSKGTTMRSYSICGDNVRTCGYTGDANAFKREVPQPRVMSKDNRTLGGGADQSGEYDYSLTTITDHNDHSDSATPQSTTPTTRLLCPISFQPFIAFKGLYCTSSNDHDTFQLQLQEAQPRSPTGLIAPPYIPVTSDTAGDVNCAGGGVGVGEGAVDDPSSPVHALHSKEDITTIFNLTSLSASHMEVSSSDCKPDAMKGMDEMRQVAGGGGGGGFISATAGVVGDNHISQLPCNSGNHILSKTAENTVLRKGGYQLKNSPDITSKSSDMVFKSNCMFTPKADNVGGLFLPCIRSDTYDLLADSLGTIAQHSHTEESAYSLEPIPTSPHSSPKLFNLILPFNEMQCDGNNVDGDTQEHCTTGDNDNDNDNGDEMASPNCFSKKQIFSAPFIDVSSTLNTDAEMSPMSPPSISSLSDMYCSDTNHFEDAVTVLPLPTIFEGRGKSSPSLHPHLLGAADPVSPMSAHSTDLSEEVQSKKRRPSDDCMKASSIAENDNVIGNDVCLGKYSLIEPIVYSDGKVVSGASKMRSRVGTLESVTLDQTPHTKRSGIKILASVTESSKQSRKSLKTVKTVNVKKIDNFPTRHRVKVKESRRRKGEGNTGPSHLVMSLVIATVGAALNNDSVGEHLISAASFLGVASRVFLKLFSFFVLTSVVLVLHQKCERTSRFRASRNRQSV